MKHVSGLLDKAGIEPAAFRRLCVETKLIGEIAPMIRDQPPSGGCVLKRITQH